MAAEIVLDNDYVTLKYHTPTKIVHHEFHKFVHGDQFRQPLSSGLELMQKRGGTKWLSDDRNNSALTPDDTTWATTVWAPAVMKAGWKHWAVVMPEKVMGQLNMKKWIAMYAEMGINANMFNDPDKALSWLEQQ